MTKYIALLRGINVGGKRKILMADLKVLLEKNGFCKVSTYIQSGNILFETNEIEVELANKIANLIQVQYGFEVPTIVVKSSDWQWISLNNPFLEEDSSIAVERLHVTLLHASPSADKLEQLLAYKFEEDRFVVKDKTIFVLVKDKYSDTKLNNSFFESKLKVSATTRNWKTVVKLAELSAII